MYFSPSVICLIVAFLTAFNGTQLYFFEESKKLNDEAKAIWFIGQWAITLSMVSLAIGLSL